MATKMSVPPFSSSHVARLSQFSSHSERNLLDTRRWCSLLLSFSTFFVCHTRLESITPINSLIRIIIVCFLLQGHENTHIFTQINRPWQGCVSRWQRWRGHGHRAVWGVALHEVNHPDTWRRTRTVQVPPWWCGLVMTGQTTGHISCDLTTLNVHANTFFDF